MPDRSFYPEAENGDSIFIENASTADQFMKDSLRVAAFRSAAHAVNIPVNHTFNGEGQTLQFRNAAERAQVEAQILENENSLSHVEHFAKGEDPTYMQAWGQVVGELLQSRGHQITVDERLSENRIELTFANTEAKQAFRNAERDNAFIGEALSRQKLIMREAGIEPTEPTGPIIDTKMTA